MSADPLSDTLALTDARCAISRGFAAGGTWALRFPAPNRLKLTAVVKGSYWLVLDDADDGADGGAEGDAGDGAGDSPEKGVLLEAGDVAVFDGRHPFVLASDPALEPVDATRLFKDSSEPIVRAGEHVADADTESADVVSVGGHIDLNRAGEELLIQALPPLIHVRATADEAPVLRWLLDQLLREMAADRAGTGFATGQLTQLMFVQVLRAYLADAESIPVGWLRALADERIAPALHLMHGDPGRPWQLSELAGAAAMSRTTFASRFRAVAGVPPLTYLHNWRMRLAERALREEDTPISSLALSLGYTSDSAFSNAFKRTIGIAPKRYRDTARAAATG
ncbi:AraC family transcriptional regulator [Streptomyces scopuliridis]|uniref:AraC family transcriptional regulator n=1 Tax=Streptomyces scopuliridis TaxID=452529 RepID=UPI00367AFDFB